MVGAMWQVLGSRTFRFVWAGETVSMLGDFSYQIAFPLLVLSTTRSPATLAGVLIVTAVPRGLLLLVGGAITDRFSPRVVMSWSHLVRFGAVTSLTLLVATSTVQVWHFYVLGVIFGVADAFFWPATSSIMPSLVSTEHLPQGNALMISSEQATRLVGPVLGGALVTFLGITVTMAFNAITFAVAVASLLAVRGVTTREAAFADHTGESTAESGFVHAVSSQLKSVASEIAHGIAYALRDPATRAILLMISAATLTYSGLFGVGLPGLAFTFHQKALALGVMVSAWGIGQLAGTVSAGITGLPRRWGLLIIGMAFFEGLGFAFMGVIPNFWVVAALLALLGFGVAYSSDVTLPTWIQINTPSDKIGRVSSVLDLPRFGLEPISLAVMGVLVAQNVRLAFLVASVPMLAAAAMLAGSRTARTLTGPATPARLQPTDNGDSQ